ncbi:hypothetical protein LQ318_08450 [Aliifodinibius salicampi]|uniref:HNH endonuclease n=1 Tax=Fodinibius salicampi TaxID=1920655 RepID=A0ABT3PYL5_9BACT|nr:hypothetical protein [Fodinibius salicampi]MCW9712933.1 hypothetical protein [Fodinibius salicampi]
MKPSDIKWLFKKKPKCVDCYFLTKFESDGMGGAINRGKVKIQERRQIEKGRIDTWLNPKLHLACFQGVWSDNFKEKERHRLEKITKGRPECDEKNRFKKFEPGEPEVEKAYKEHQKEMERKEPVPMFKTPGYVLTIIIGLLSIFVGLLSIPSIRNWFFSLFN